MKFLYSLLLAELKVHGKIDKIILVRVKSSKQANQKIISPGRMSLTTAESAIYPENYFQCCRVEVVKGKVPKHCY